MPRSTRSNSLQSSIAAAIEPLEARVLLSTYTVTNLNDAGSGSLRDAIQQANSNAGADAIGFAPGLNGAITLTTGDVTINTDDLTITGPGASMLAVGGGLVVDDLGSLHGVHAQISGLGIGAVTGDMPDTQITLADCTVGNVETWGAAVIRRCTVSGILAHGSAGFDVSDTTLHGADFPAGSTAVGSFTDCTITGSSGDGIYAYDEGTTVTLTRCTVSGNAGAGIRTEDGFINVIDSTISGNDGAGINGNDQPTLTVSGSTISHNKGTGITYNGGMAAGLTLVNSTVANNMGGGINAGGFLTVTNSTIVGNVGTTGAGISFGGSFGLGYTARINNTIVAANRNASGASDIGAPGPIPFTGAYDLIGTGGSGGLVTGHNGNVVGVADPMLNPLGSYGGPAQTMPPLARSPAIDAGSNALAVGPDGQPLTTDQRGYNRIFNGTVDIGSVEFGFAPSNPVVTNLNDSGPGSLRQAILDANVNFGPDTITFASGLNGIIGLTSGALSISDDLNLVGPGAGVISVSGMNASTVFDVVGGSVSISVEMSDLTITGGHSNQPATTPGGGINNLGSAHLTLDACALTHNQGGAIYNTGILDVTNCAFSQNVSLGDAAIEDFRGKVTIANSKFTGNTGGGIIATGSGILTILNSTIAGNTSDIGIGDGEGLLTVMNTTISGTTGDLGAIKNYCAMVRCSLINCTLTGNKVGINVFDGIANLTNCTIAGNGTGVVADGDVLLETRVSLANTIVAKNGSDVALRGQVLSVSGSNNLIGTGGSGGLVNGQNGNIVGVADPMLSPLGDHGGPTQTMPPLAGSPAIDAGNNALAVDADGKPLISDQRGDYRIVNSTVDIGSVEFNSTPLVPGDANGDGTVNFDDLLILAQHYGTTAAQNYGTMAGTIWPDGDFTGDGAVNFDDLLLLAQNYGKTRAGR